MTSELENLLSMAVPVVFVLSVYLFAYRQSKKIGYSLGMAGLGFLILLGSAIGGGMLMWVMIPFPYTFGVLMLTGTLIIIKIIINAHPLIISSESYLVLVEKEIQMQGAKTVS
jgi:hypothetical protein